MNQPRRRGEPRNNRELTKKTTVRGCHTQRTRRSRSDHKGQLLQQLYLRLQPGIRDHVNNKRSAEDGSNVFHRGAGAVRGCSLVDDWQFRDVRASDDTAKARVGAVMSQ